MSNRLILAPLLAAALFLGACGSSEEGPISSDSTDLSVGDDGEESSTGGTWRDEGNGLWKLDMGIEGYEDDIYGRCLPSGSLAIRATYPAGGASYVLDGCIEGHPK